MPDIVDRADPFSLCIGWKWGKPCRINPAFDCGDFPFDSGEPSLMNISRYEGHRYAFEIHQYT